MNGLKYQLKNISKDKMCILSFLLPIIVGIAIHFISAASFTAVNEISFGIIGNDLPKETVDWLKESGIVTPFGSIQELKAQILEPSSQMIGVMQNGDGIQTMLAGDELSVSVKIADSLPNLYENRGSFQDGNVKILPNASDSNVLKSLLIVITMVTAMFMGCTFNAMSIIGEKEDGVALINEILPMTPTNYLLQKILLGFAGGEPQPAPDTAADDRAVVQDVVPASGGAHHCSGKSVFHRLILVLFLRHLFADPFQEGKNGFGQAHDGLVTLRFLDRLRADERIILVERIERREQYAQHQHVFQHRHRDTQHDVGNPESREVKQLAYQPSGNGHQKNHGQQDHDESAGCGYRLVQLQPLPDINAVT